MLDAKRPIGSLIKPAVYLTALERPQQYSLATLIEDEPLQVEQRGSPVWEPNNYDKEFHGDVMLYQALANSYNVATARLGMELSLDAVIQTLRRLGVSSPSECLSIFIARCSRFKSARSHRVLSDDCQWWLSNAITQYSSCA